MTLLYPTMPKYPYHYVTSAPYPPWKFGTSPNSWLENPIFRKPYMRHGWITNWPMPTTAQTSTCSGMQAKPFYEVAFATMYKSKVLTNFREASDRLQHAQAQLSTSNTPTHHEIWRNAKTNFDLWMESQEHIHKSKSELQHHKFGNKSEKLSFAKVHMFPFT